MEKELEIKIYEIKTLLYQHEISCLIKRISDLLTLLLQKQAADNARLKEFTLFIFEALQQQDYLLAVDLLTYEVLPLYQGKEGLK